MQVTEQRFKKFKQLVQDTQLVVNSSAGISQWAVWLPDAMLLNGIW